METNRGGKGQTPFQPAAAGRPDVRKNNFFDDSHDDDFSSYFSKKKTSHSFDDEEETGPPSSGKSGDPKKGLPALWSSDPYHSSGIPEEKPLSARELYLQEVKSIQDRTLDTTHRSLRLIDESEAVGTAAAEELISQREQLENADRNLDNMNSTLDQSQKHINNIKSIFGGIKNWWVSKPASTDLPGSSSDSTDNLRAVVEKSTKVAGPAQPAFGPEGHSPYRSNSDFPASSQSNLGSSPLPNKNYDAVLDSNLDQMSLGLSRLKGLAEGLGGEIATQNNLLDSLNSKTERVDLKVAQQQTQMDRILGKKK